MEDSSQTERKYVLSALLLSRKIERLVFISSHELVKVLCV